MSTLVEVVHFADAACPWDYSAEPVRIALEADYGEQLSWRTVQVGLHESGEAMAGRGYTGGTPFFGPLTVRVGGCSDGR